MSKKENVTKSNNNLNNIKELFDNSDEEIDTTDVKLDSYINYFTNFDKWTMHHYYAMKNREKYPNMFFYYFPTSLFQISKIEEQDKSKVIDYILKMDEKKLNGRWGYLSLVLENANINGEQLYNSISNNRAIINFSNSFPLKEDAKADFDKSIEEKVKNILNKKMNLYNEVLSEFEKYLKENTDISKRKKYYNFLKNHENMYIYCDQSKNMNEFLLGLLELNSEDNNNNINNNIMLLPENYKEMQKNNSKEKENNDDVMMNPDENNISKKKGKSKRKLVKNKKLYKFDFDLDSFDDFSNDEELSLSSEYKLDKLDKINSKTKKIISDEDNNDFNINNNNGKLNEIPLDLSKDNKSKKNKRSKNSKKDISLKSEIKYLENNNKENQIKNNLDSIQNSGFKSSLNTIKNQNMNYSTNLSSNINLLSSKSNLENILIPKNKNENKENKNKEEVVIELKENSEKSENKNDNADIEYYQNEQQINGYASDFTKKIYYPKQIKNKTLVFSDNEENNYLKKYAPRKKQKITRIKANENVIIRDKKNIRNFNDFVVIGIESGYIDKNIEKLKRGLLHKKMEIRKRKNKNKINMKIKQLKKQYKEEDISIIKKYKGNYNKLIREIKKLEKNKIKEKPEEKKQINNFRSKKGNYYEIASKKNFNLDLNLNEKNNNDINFNINSNKNEKRFFNCFTNREKEDLNFSDTDSFLSLFNNAKNDGVYKRKNRNNNNNKKFKLKEYYDNSRNQNINTFFPKISQDNFIKDRQIVISIRKLIANEKYEELFNFIMKDINLDSKIPQYVSDICNKIFKYSNEIDFEKLNKYKTLNGYEVKMNNSDNSDNLIIQENIIIINDQFDIEKMDSLFKAYLEKLQIALTFLLAESKYNNSIGLNYKKEELNIFMELNVVENLLKLIIININKTQSINFGEYAQNNIYINESSTNDYIKNELSKYFTKIKTIFNDLFMNNLSEIFITFIRFFISYKPKDVKLMDVEDFCFMSYTFLQIMQALFQKIKELEDINKKFNINISYIPNIATIREITNKYIKCLCLFLLNHLFIYSPRDFIPLITQSLKREASFGQMSTPPESLIIVALFKSISSLYIELNHDNNSNNNIKEEESSFIMVDILFSEYLNNEIDIDTSNLGSLNEILIKELRDYLSSNLNNCLSKDKKKLSIIGNIKKVFLYNCFEIDNFRENEHCIKIMIQKKIILNLIQRYLFILISYFIYYGKNVDCLQFFNEFYKKYNNAIDNNNLNNSYFDVDLIKEIIDKNMKLNLNKLVKNYLVEEYIYSDIQLMNFYDQYWQISFENKRTFIKNYFEIMCNNKYKSRNIDKIFQKSEILSLINSIFEFKDQQNNINKSFDISQDEIENKQENIINSFDSILIKAIYMISESINKTLITLDTNNNEDKIKKNLSKIISLLNIFANNISQLNSDNYTLFIIPMISTILIFTQHLLKFKEKINIENTMNKIKTLLKFESSGLMLKSFSLSLWINIIQKISEKNSNIEIGEYIKMINVIIHQMVDEYHKSQQRGFSMQMYSNTNYDSWNNKKEKDYFEIINDYLMNIKNFADKNPILLIKYYSILNEIYDILNIKFYYPPKMRIQLIEIINSLINHINISDKQINDQLSILNKNNNNSLNVDEDEIMFDSLNGNIINSLFNDNEDNYKFYNFLKEKIMPNIKHILDIFISTENTNVMNKKKILYPLYESNALLYANIFGILIKKGINQNHLEYPSYVFNLYYNKENDKSNLFDSVFKSIYSNKNELEKECYIKLPFKLLDIFLNYYHNFIGEIIHDKNFNLIIKYYLELFFIGIFTINNKKNKNILLNYEIKFCEKFFAYIKSNIDLLISEKEKIKNEFNLKNYISDDYKIKVCLINLMIILAKIDDNDNDINNNKIGSNKFNEIVFGELLAKLSLNFNIDQIDSEIFFEIINGQKTKIALNQINKLSNFSNGYNNSQKFNDNEINVKLYILSKYQDRYIKSQLNNKFTSYIDDFINELTGEQLISSIVTLNFINSLLSQEKNFSKKFETCLRKVYNILISKSSDLCNILSLKDKEGNLKQDFSNIEINEIISSINKRYPNYISLKNNIYSLDTNFLLKDNIKNKFILELPLDNSISSNFYPNLLRAISNTRNNNYSYDKNYNKYYEEAIYYYVSLCNIMNKETKIYEINKSLIKLYDLIENSNTYNINYIYDLKSFYVFLFFLEKINEFISVVIRIEDLENYSNNSTSFLSEDNLISNDFIKRSINIIEAVCSFMYQYIILILKGHSINNKYVHSFIIKKMKSFIKKNCSYFTNNINIDDNNNFMNEYLKEKYGESMILKGYKIIEKITNNIKIYSRNDEEINKRIDFIKFINFDGIQYIMNNSSYK